MVDVSNIPLSRIREVICYDPSTGEFTWKNRKDANAQWNGRYAGTQAGWKDWKGYTILTIDYRHYRAHRIAWYYMRGEAPLGDIDHINGDVSDNRIDNLREATRSQNNLNTKISKRNTSGIRGVSWDKTRGKWEAYIKLKGKRRHLGRFERIEDAASARRLAAEKSYGNFAKELK